MQCLGAPLRRTSPPAARAVSSPLCSPLQQPHTHPRLPLEVKQQLTLHQLALHQLALHASQSLRDLRTPPSHSLAWSQTAAATARAGVLCSWSQVSVLVCLCRRGRLGQWRAPRTCMVCERFGGGQNDREWYRGEHSVVFTLTTHAFHVNKAWARTPVDAKKRKYTVT